MAQTWELTANREWFQAFIANQHNISKDRDMDKWGTHVSNTPNSMFSPKGINAQYKLGVKDQYHQEFKSLTQPEGLVNQINASKVGLHKKGTLIQIFKRLKGFSLDLFSSNHHSEEYSNDIKRPRWI